MQQKMVCLPRTLTASSRIRQGRYGPEHRRAWRFLAPAVLRFLETFRRYYADAYSALQKTRLDGFGLPPQIAFCACNVTKWLPARLEPPIFESLAGKMVCAAPKG